MNFWCWLGANAEALQSLFAMVSAVLTLITIVVLGFTWNAIRTQAKEARALTKAANEQVDGTKKQTEAAMRSAAATDSANRISEEANKLSTKKIQADLLPILIYDSVFDQRKNMACDTIRNVGPGPAKEVQMSIGLAKDETPKTYISSRTLIGSADYVTISINQEMFSKFGMTIHYKSLDGRRFVTSISKLEGAIKHDFEELKP